MPRTRLYGLLLEFRAEGGVVHQSRPVQACRATLVAKTAQVVALVLPYIAIPRNVETIRPTPAVVAILKSVNERRSERRCTQEDHARKVFCLRTGFGIEDAHAARPILLLVVDELVHNGV